MTDQKSNKSRVVAQALQAWFEQNRRPLPWRNHRDPYKIWISEIMLQQTTVAAVVPYFNRFTEELPNVQSLARAPLTQVLKLWAGLGYYSRARNLHKAAQLFAKNGFSKTYQELITHPGLGPYTSRAIASLAFNQKVGVVDGNVIRVISRFLGKDFEWWKTKPKEEIQSFVDEAVATADPWLFNQAVMELGATVCTYKSPTCFLCPLQKHCVAFKKGLIEKLPRPKPKKESEIWLWKAEVHQKKDKVALTSLHPSPFLKGQPLFPGTFKKLSASPKKWDVRHSITHHDIYIQISKPLRSSLAGEIIWVPIKKIAEVNPSSLIKKILSAQGISSS